jgi:hypothetical protein
LLDRDFNEVANNYDVERCETNNTTLGENGKGDNDDERERRVLLTTTVNCDFNGEDNFLSFFCKVEKYLYE